MHAQQTYNVGIEIILLDELVVVLERALGACHRNSPKVADCQADCTSYLQTSWKSTVPVIDREEVNKNR